MKAGITLTTCLVLLTASKIFGQKDFCTEGYASFYHDYFDGKLTASGEVFNQNKLTCAHRYLPFGTKLRIINPANNKSVVVTVNDRGPYFPGRIVDLTKAAAKKLGFIQEGHVKVEIEIVSSENNIDSLYFTNDTIHHFYNVSLADSCLSGYSIKIASYYSETKTYEVIASLKQALDREVFVQTVLKNNAIMYRIFAGRFDARKDAEEFQEKIKPYYPECYVVKLSQFRDAKVR